MKGFFGCLALILTGILIFIASAENPYFILWVGLILVVMLLIDKLIIEPWLKNDEPVTPGAKDLSESYTIPSVEKSEMSDFSIDCQNEKYQDNQEETLEVADEIFQYCRRMENDEAFCNELSKHNIELLDVNDEPLLGKGADVRRLFFVDIAHCYSEMNPHIDLERRDSTAILYLLTKLYSPDLSLNHTDESIALLVAEMSYIMTKFVNAIADAPVFQEDDEADFLVAMVLLQYDHDEFCRYLSLLYRFCSLVAKADGNITSEEQAFIDHIFHLRYNTVSAYGNVSISSSTNVSADPFEELNQLIGLESVKEEVRTLSNFVKIQMSRKAKGLKISPISYHCVLTGNPGTGKTTVARIIAGIYAKLGVLKKGHLVETDRSGLVAEYVGQTAVKTNKVIDSALDGVLFIDEAYSLVSGDNTDYGKEAIATLLKRMEDNRNQLVVILAGYDDEMKQFIDSNPGLQSRFNRYIHFPDFTADELYEIFLSLVKKYDYELTADASSAILDILTETVNNKGKNFGNGRMVRNLFEKTLECQSNRLASVSTPTLKQLKEITKEDVG